MRSAALLLMMALLVARAVGEEAPVFKAYRHPVVTWVPPYGLARAKARLRAPGANPLAGEALTHVALQFWAPTSQGGVEIVKKYDPLTDAVIAEWREWAHVHGARALLCIYNGVEKWDWGLARDAFAGHREEFVHALLAELERHGLDGIDIDLEGDGAFDADRPAFREFLAALSAELKVRGKQLFVDSFPHIWNAPNVAWWPELFPLVDGLSSMGYEETGANSSDWRNYRTQIAAAGANAAKLLIGVPTHLEHWQEASLLEHLQGVQRAGQPGIALWDAQFRAAPWNANGPWEVLRAIRGEP